MYVTTRTLQGIIRLSQAMAKLSFRDRVTQLDVDEAIRLMDYSIRSLRRSQGSAKQQKQENRQQQGADRSTLIMHQVRDIYNNKGSKPIDMQLLLNQINKRDVTSMTKEELKDILNYWQRMQVIFITPDDQLTFL